MKAAVNGVPSLSVLEVGGLRVTWRASPGGRSVMVRATTPTHRRRLRRCIKKLEESVIPLYYRDPDGYARVMQMAIALNGSFFNTERMVDQYVTNAYRVPTLAPA